MGNVNENKNLVMNGDDKDKTFDMSLIDRIAAYQASKMTVAKIEEPKPCPKFPVDFTSPQKERQRSTSTSFVTEIKNDGLALSLNESENRSMTPNPTQTASMRKKNLETEPLQPNVNQPIQFTEEQRQQQLMTIYVQECNKLKKQFYDALKSNPSMKNELVKIMQREVAALQAKFTAAGGKVPNGNIVKSENPVQTPMQPPVQVPVQPSLQPN